MKIAKIQMTAAAMMSMLLLGGCGVTPYELTQKEENIIVDYSAHIVTKYNSYQKEGIVYIAQEELEAPVDEGAQEDIPEDMPVPEEGDPAASGGESEGTEDFVPQTTLTELFGREGISVNYTGAYLTDSYVDDVDYSVEADAGKIYLVMNIDITNSTGSDVSFDNLVASPQFKVTVNDTETASSAMTFLSEDFSIYEETIEAGSTKATVLLFVLPDSVTEIQNILLEVKVNDGSYQIIL